VKQISQVKGGVKIRQKQYKTPKTEKKKQNDASQLFLSGVRCQKSGKISEAANYYRNAILLDPNIPDVYNNLGVVLRQLGNTNAAIACYKKCLHLRPKNAGVYSNLGNAFRDIGKLEHAAKNHKKSIGILNNNPESHFNLGLVLRDLGMLEDALLSFNRALELKPENADYQWDKALTLLTMGDFKNGFDQYESRWNLKRNPPRAFARPLWEGESLKNKTLLIYQEQGFGDMIQFARFIPSAKELGGRIYLEVQPELYNLFSTIPGVDLIFKKGEKITGFDFCIPMMSLFHRLKLSINSVSLKLPYLSPPGKKSVNIPRTNQKNKNIGIVWAGKRSHKNDANRSCSFENFIDLLGIPNLSIYSLQKGDREAEFKEYGCDSLIIDLANKIKGFDDTASIISQLDLVISVDTATAHLAGALGTPVWVILPFSPDWRWMRKTNVSPWYPTMKLFRQKKPNEWNSVFSEIRKKLSANLGS